MLINSDGFCDWLDNITILTVNSVTGEKTVRHVMDGGSFQISHIDENSGNLFLKRGNYLYEYDISNDTIVPRKLKPPKWTVNS